MESSASHRLRSETRRGSTNLQSIETLSNNLMRISMHSLLLAISSAYETLQKKLLYYELELTRTDGCGLPITLPELQQGVSHLVSVTLELEQICRTLKIVCDQFLSQTKDAS